MAVKGGLSSKRFGYVGVKPNLRSKKSNSRAPDREEESRNCETEVRGVFTIGKLMKKGDRFYKDAENVCVDDRPSLSSNENEDSCASATGRKRKNSETASQPRQKCLNKNALSAKMNRERKKKYILSLETENKCHKEENDELNKKIEMQNKSILHLKREISYLKSVLANSKELCQIMQSIKSTGLPVTSSLDSFTKESKKMIDSQNKENSTECGERDLFHDQNPHQARKTCDDLPISGEDINLGSLTNLSDLQLLNLESPFYNFNFAMNEPDFNGEITPDFNFDEENLGFDEPDSGGLSEGGICLHLNKKMISLEFCYFCNKNNALSVLAPPN